MSPVDRELAIKFAEDVRQAMSLGYLQDVPVASSLQSRYHDQYEVLVGQHKEPLQEVDYNKFSVACALLFAGKNNPMDAECPWVEVFFRDREASRALLKCHARRLLERHGFSGQFKLATRGLRMSGKGSNGLQICSPSDTTQPGVIGGLLVDYPYDFRGGKINVTRGSRTESFDFSKTSKADNMVSVLFWHSGSLVTTEPLKKGFRACLLCDVVIDPDNPAPLFLNPSSNIMRNFEKDVVFKHKTHMPLVRIIVRRFWDSPETAPKNLSSLWTFVVREYLKEFERAESHGYLKLGSNLPEALRDGWEIIHSFGGENNMRRFCGERYTVAFVGKLRGYCS